MKENKQNRQNFDNYQKLMDQKFDKEDRMAHIFNERWKLKNENLQCSQQLRLIEDQIRNIFSRERIELMKKEEE